MVEHGHVSILYSCNLNFVCLENPPHEGVILWLCVRQSIGKIARGVQGNFRSHTFSG